MKYLIDTDYVISYLHNYKKAVQLLHQYEGELAISIITLGELLEEVYGQPEEKRQLEGLEKFLTGVTVIPIERVVIEYFAHIRADLRKKNNLIDSMDVLIAATTLTHNLILITGNTKHFSRIKGLKVVS